jgi:DNA-binding response OmpR family regulator
MKLKEDEKKVFEDFLSFLQLHPELKKWELSSEPVLSLVGLNIYPDRYKVYHDEKEIKLNTKEFSLLCLLVVNKGRVLTYGQMYQKIWQEEPFGNEHIAVGSHVRSMRQKLYAAYPKSPFTISCIRDVGYRFDIES